MQKHNVRSAGDALAYITDCTLATVSLMAMKKRRPAGEYARQIAIAQTAINWMQEMGVDIETTRAGDAVREGGVAEWAEKYER